MRLVDLLGCDWTFLVEIGGHFRMTLMDPFKMRLVDLLG